jgi:hypothetical protein
VKPTELDWLGGYREWSDGIAASLDSGLVISRADCESTFDDEVGAPPRARLQPVAAAARGGCETPSPAAWREGKAELVRALMDVHDDLLPPRRQRDFSELAASSVGVRPDVHCWQPGAWATFHEQYAVVRGGEETSLKGIADDARDRIDLEPGVCAALGRYLRRVRPPPLTYQNFELAEALVVLTHQAEHLKSPSTSEPEVECYAVQHVRPLVRAAGWDEEFATEIALHAWEISYERLPPQFRTPACRDGGPLDRHPGSSAWP